MSDPGDPTDEAAEPPPETPAQREGRAVRARLLMLAVWVGMWNNDALWGGSVWFFHDLRHHHYPWRAFAARAWANNEVPLWAPIAHGYPLMADGQAGVLYPVNVALYSLFSEPVAFDWSVISHHLLAVFGGFWLARVLGRSVDGAALAGVAFGFSGFLISHLVYLGMFQVIAWAPWMIGCAILGARRGGAWWAAGAICTAMAWLAGHPQVALYASYAAAFGAVLETVTQVRTAVDRPEKLRAAARGAGLFTMAGVALLIALPQLVASFELSRFGARDGGVDADFAAMGGLPPEELVNAVFPWTFGLESPADVPITYHHRAGDYVGRGISAWEDCFYLGVPIALMAIAAGTSKRGRAWWILALVGVVLMLGASTPLYPLFRLLPGMSYFRFPVRGALFVVIAASQLSALGVDRMSAWLLGAPDRVEKRGQIALGAALGLVVLAGLAHGALLAASPALMPALTAKFTHADGPEPRTAAEAAIRAQGLIDTLAWASSPISPAVLWPAVLIAAVGVLGILAARGRIERSTPAWVLPILALLDLGVLGFGYNPRTPTETVLERPPAAVRFLGEPGGPFRVSVLDRRVDSELDTTLMSSNLGLLWGAEDVIVPSPLRTLRNEAYLARVGLDLAIDDPTPPVDRFLANRRLADLSGIRYLLTVHELDVPDLELLETDGAVRLYENRRAFPRAFAVGCTVRVEKGADPLDALLQIDDFAATASVEGPGLAECNPGPVGTVTVPPRAHQARLQVDADLDRPGFLVITESWYPGLVIEIRDDTDHDGDIDDQDELPPLVEPLRTDDLFLGVPLQAGKHRVTLVYVPMAVDFALIVSFIAGMGASAWVVLARRR